MAISSDFVALSLGNKKRNVVVSNDAESKGLSLKERKKGINPGDVERKEGKGEERKKQQSRVSN